MKREDLFEAIGGADERYLVQSERKRTHYVLRRTVLVAACLSLFCITAMAIAPVRNTILQIFVQSPVHSTQKEIVMPNGQKMWLDYPGYQQITFTMQQNDTQPEQIETFYLPKAALNWKNDGLDQLFADENRAVSTSIAFTTDENQTVLFRQIVIPKDGCFSDSLPNADASQDSFVAGDQNVIRFSFDDGSVCYWSDGTYLFCLTAWNMSQADYETLFQLQTIDDLAPYIINKEVHEPQTLTIVSLIPPKGFDLQSNENGSTIWVNGFEMITLRQWKADKSTILGEGSDQVRWVDNVMLCDLTEDDTVCGIIAMWEQDEYSYELEYRSKTITDKEMVDLIATINYRE